MYRARSAVLEDDGLPTNYCVQKKGGAPLDQFEVEDEDENATLPGFRFHPTDEELVGFYLRRKVAKKTIRMEIIKEMDIYKYDPWDLARLNTLGVAEKEWYFFCQRGKKYRNSVRPNRVTASGFWKATGIDKKVMSSGGWGGKDREHFLGLKKSLVYYVGKAGKGSKKTDWMMHEFRLPPASNGCDIGTAHDLPEAESWTVCKIFKRNSTPKRIFTGQVRGEADAKQSSYPSPDSCVIDSTDRSSAGDVSRGPPGAPYEHPPAVDPRSGLQEEGYHHCYVGGDANTALEGDPPPVNLVDECLDENFMLLDSYVDGFQDPTFWDGRTFGLL